MYEKEKSLTLDYIINECFNVYKDGSSVYHPYVIAKSRDVIENAIYMLYQLSGNVFINEIFSKDMHKYMDLSGYDPEKEDEFYEDEFYKEGK